MGDSSCKTGNVTSRLLNPWILNFQKLGLELKCALCLDLFSGPMLLPCNHIFCKTCLPISSQFETDCPLCKTQFLDRDMRSVLFMENMVNIYRNLDTTFSANLFQPIFSDARAVLKQCPISVNKNCGDTSSKEQSGKFPVDSSCKSTSKQKCEKKVQVQSSLHMSGDVVGVNEKLVWPFKSEGREGAEKCRTSKMDENETEQLVGYSPPPFGDGKGTDDSSDEYLDLSSANSSENNKPIKRSSSEGQFRDSKRQKKLNYGQLDMHINPVMQSGPLVASNSDPKNVSETGQVTIMQPSTVSNGTLVNDSSICMFCQSSKISEDTGSLLHYADGKLVVGDEALLQNVINVHRTCIDWAPQVYYVGDTVMNLETEVARGAKLKCSKCGLKGAALGCYKQSCRRSYHVPCAVGTSGCRWDSENFLLLCPSHSSSRFPNEKSKSGKTNTRNHSMLSQKTEQCTSDWVAPSDEAKKWVFCGSALSPEERYLLIKFAEICGASVSKSWRSDVTHVIAATDKNGACTRTFKFLMGVLNGRWILKIDWIKACMEAKRPMEEEPYEVSLDNYGCNDGPRNGRIRARDKGVPKLFKGLCFHFTGDFHEAYEEDLQELIISAGGTVGDGKESEAQNCENNSEGPKKLVVYNLDAPQGCKVGEEVTILWQRMNEAEGLATQIGAQVIGHTWLVESVAASKLQPLLS